MPETAYVPALRFERLTALYDPVVRLTTRESAFKRRLLAQACLAPGARVLDLGCGTGTLAIQAKGEHPGARVHGLDGDPAILERARAKARAASADVDFVEALSDRMPYPDRSFDTVLSTLFFHHLTPASRTRTIAEIARVLRPSGELHVADWGRPDGLYTRASFLVLRLFDGLEQTRASARGELPRLLEAGGLAEVRERGRMRSAFGSLTFHSARRPV